MRKVASPPQRGHLCHGLNGHHDGEWWLAYAGSGMEWAAQGTVMGCDECGRTWVAGRPYYNVFMTYWRREGRFERWRRERRQRKEAAA